ncbi:MAG TPA: HoxN/HupN/NixA family nickel/cobalt transporter [Stellaceae bacterium]|jgi:high-affinity nickel-transport protein
MRSRITGLYVILLIANLAIWALALVAFGGDAVLLGTALLAYGFGLRHAVDADHIAAIDNVTRKLMHDGKRPAAVGFFFALGHSTVVIAASVVVAVTAGSLEASHPRLVAAGGVVGTAVSALFLFAIAAVNMVVLAGVFRLLRRGGRYGDAELDRFLARRGLMARVLGRLTRLIGQSWHMYPLGFLFGLGFDTATEIALLGISAAAAAHGLSVWSILVFPALFTAGMSLVDTTDGVVMLGAYGWAFANPLRKLYYNLAVTAVSVVVAVVIGGIEAFGLSANRVGLSGGVWDAVAFANDHFAVLGYAIVAIFGLSWLVSVVVYRLKGYDKAGA